MNTTREAVWPLVCAATATAALTPAAPAQHLRLLGDLNSAPASSVFFPSGPTLGEGGAALAYFVLGDFASGLEVWRTDGTPAGTLPLGDLNSFRPSIFGVAGERAVFESAGYLLGWAGTPGEFEMLLPGPVAIINRNSIDAYLPHARLGQRLFFATRPFSSQYEQLFATDGTAAGTSVLYTTSSPFSPGISSIAATPTRVFATADYTTQNSRTLLVTDGSAPASVVRSFPGAGSTGLIGSLTPVGESVYFIAPDTQVRRQFWISNGTDAGTVQLTGLTGGGLIGVPTWNGVPGAGSRVAFLGPQTPASGGPPNFLWISNGTPAGTARAGFAAQVWDDFTYPDMPATARGPMVSINGGFAFVAVAGGGGFPPHALRFGDGSVAGTAPISTGAADVAEFVGVSRGAPGSGADLAYFIAVESARFRLWRTDGTQAGTLMLPLPPSFDVRPLAMLGERLVYGTLITPSPPRWSIWMTDGTPDGTSQLAGEGLTPLGTANSNPTEIAGFGGGIVFNGTTPPTGTERFQATAASLSATSCEETVPGVSSGGAQSFTVAGGRLFALIRRPIVVDGNPVDAAAMVASTDAGLLGQTLAEATGTSSIGPPAPFGNGVLFYGPTEVADDPTLWKSDGTPGGGGPGPVVGTPGPGRPLHPDKAFEWNGRAYFTGWGNPGPATALWVTDGTEAGTLQLALLPGSLAINTAYRALPDRLYFDARDAGGFNRLWVTDGTPGGTHMVDATLEAYQGDSKMAVLDGRLIVAGFRNGEQADLWTPAPGDGSLVPIVPVRTGVSSWLTLAETAVGTRLFFVANDGVHGTELWKTDGTGPGTGMVIDLWPGPMSSGPSALVAAGAHGLVFTASTAQTGRELWATDGTAAGTRLLVDINPGVGSSIPQPRLYQGGVVYMSAYRPDVGSEPWALVLADCAADINGDDRLNSQDFFDFLGRFFAGEPAADFNRDGVINSQDFFDYLTAFMAGCP